MTIAEVTKEIKWSKQQAAFIEWCINGRGSCVLEAVAGAGKTTTLIEAARKMPGQVAICAYNKKIANEIKDKLEKLQIDWRKVQGGTVHSFGFGAYRRAFKNVKVDDHKVDNWLEGRTQNDEFLTSISSQVAHLVSLAKQRAIGVLARIDDWDAWRDIIEHFALFEEGPESAVEPAIALAIEALKASNQITSIIDFDDMVYLPLLLKLKFWQFDNVMVDEAQDTNPARRALVRALVKKGGRVIAVGDRHQAIYGFTGADSDALDLIVQDFHCIRMPLTITYRCPKQVVSFSQQWVNHIHAADEAPEGKVIQLHMKDFLAKPIEELDKTCAVLCRLNKPLVALAFQLIRKKVPCRVEGRDIAANLRKLITRWKVNNLDQLENKLDQYLERETTKLLAKKQETKLQLVEDTVETIKTIIDQCQKEQKHKLQDAIDYINELFADDVKDMLVLSSIHKSKGREWPNVYWLDRAGTCPSRWARQEWQQEQEINLCYVAATRAQEVLIELQAAANGEENAKPRKETNQLVPN